MLVVFCNFASLNLKALRTTICWWIQQPRMDNASILIENVIGKYENKQDGAKYVNPH